MTVAGQWLDPGKYLLQLALDPARCRCEIGQHGSLPWEVSWKLQLLPTAEAKACPVVPDDSKQKYSQVRLSCFIPHRTGCQERHERAAGAARCDSLQHLTLGITSESDLYSIAATV